VRLLAYGVLMAGLAVTLLIVDKGNALVVGIVTGLIAGLAIPLIDAFLVNLPHLRFWVSTVRFRGTYVRVSAAYLYRIKVHDTYLLVRSQRRPGQFQPVGGAWKALPEAHAVLAGLEALDDDLLPIDDTSKHDLRLRIKGRHLLAFLRWFDRGVQRETEPWREFYEELVRPGHLRHSDFPWTYYRHLRRARGPIRFSDEIQGYQLRIADVYELTPTDAQRAVLEELRKGVDENLLWADEALIRRRGMQPKMTPTVRIADSADLIL
jgi:CBASS immunity effector Cap15-like protein